MKQNENCELCPLHLNANHVCMWGDGIRRKGIVVVGDTPSADDDAEGVPFFDDGGELVRKHLERAGLKHVYLTMAVKCSPPEGKNPVKRQIAACSGYLEEELTGAKYVLLLGNTALQAVLGLKGVKKLRGQAIVKEGVTYFPTYSPGYILRDPTQEGVFKTDIENFAAIALGYREVDSTPDIDVRVLETDEDVREALQDLKKSRVVSFDLETTGLYAWAAGSQIVSFGLGTENSQWILPVGHSSSPWTLHRARKIILGMIHASRRATIVAHNGKFDLLWLRVTMDIKWRVDFDTMLASHILDENRKHGLKLLASSILGAPNYDIDVGAKQGQSLFSTLAKYHALDLYYTLKLYHHFRRELSEEPAIERLFFHLTMPAHEMFFEAEYRGVAINLDQFKRTEKKLRQRLFQAQAKLKRVADINWGSPKQVGDLLFKKLKIESVEKTKSGADSTSESVLKRIDHPAVKTLLEFREAKQQLSFFIEGWKPFLDGSFLHPSFKIHGTVTGRLSCENPNLQQVPRDPEIRSLIDGFIDSFGHRWVLVEADLSQIELRIAAELSGDDEMIYCFTHGIDIHWKTVLRELFRGGGEKELILRTASGITGSKVTNYSKAIDILEKAGPDAAVKIDGQWKELRKKAKAINFGYLYGMWWKKFVDYARDNYGVKVTDEEAEASRNFFFQTYEKLGPWHKRQKDFVRRNGYVRSLIGRKRRLPDAQLSNPHQDRMVKSKIQSAERQAVNSPVQGLASDLNIMAALELRKRWGPSRVYLGGTVHDAVLVWVREDVLKKVVVDIKDCMENPPMLKEVFNVEFQVPIEADVKIGPWGKGKSPEEYFSEAA